MLNIKSNAKKLKTKNQLQVKKREKETLPMRPPGMKQCRWGQVCFVDYAQCMACEQRVKERSVPYFHF